MHNPNQRPSLLEWHSWPQVPLLDLDNIERKASRLGRTRPRQDSMEVNGRDTTAPNAKKQRLTCHIRRG